jgi:hypothetical protein
VNLGEQKIRGKKEKLEAFGYFVATKHSHPRKRGAAANVVALKKFHTV